MGGSSRVLKCLIGGIHAAHPGTNVPRSAVVMFGGRDRGDGWETSLTPDPSPPFHGGEGRKSGQ